MRQAMAHATRQAVRASGGRPVPPINLHITLAFLGSVPERRLPELAEVARVAALDRAPAQADVPGSTSGPDGGHAGPPAKRLELALDHLEYWGAAQLLCALPAQPPPQAVALGGRLLDELAARGFAQDLKDSGSVGAAPARQLRPHVTLARKAHRPRRVLEMDCVTWSFPDFVLVDSKTLPGGSVYTILQRFSFVSDPGPFRP